VADGASLIPECWFWVLEMDGMCEAIGEVLLDFFLDYQDTSLDINLTPVELVIIDGLGAVGRAQEEDFLTASHGHWEGGA
jgi:hypothetical protein